ncbi:MULTISPECIES: hypothetical protein [Chromobacteriaceae]|uniref:Uncharacterized protein n=3 Tax=Chromobacteriaceae TaxID=1499392 RepID=A0ABV0H3R9_9NEIS|nr:MULTISPECIES: hypothetical protein [Chromobacteriaceae]AVG14467.1 hypothetical protein CFN79_00455 [Chromobacterium vaccinii]ERE00080.1 hypothetical protein O166_15660 [Pseudogulbenkiania ferrooxidans EGD-HP2]MBX9297316.1 hypothetical protein [Chromobacterium vaccinii]MBX9346243.1 hypothetical protein [Chromobacterium vaccinii]MBX9355978.1 hypothetical protein [Chromobacterium vaccinii]
MKNDACLQQLQLTLVELPEAELRKILRDYRGYIRGAVADRASESRLLAVLADTRQLAAGLSRRSGRERLAIHGLALAAALAATLAGYWLFLN